MEELTPLGMWLRPDGCCNGPTWVAMEFNSLIFWFLRRGWKLIALTQGLQDGHVLHFKFDGAAALFMKAFGSTGGRLNCCMEDSSSGPSSALYLWRALVFPCMGVA
ncbi:heat shock cognate 70 kda protein 1 [Hordeum vulgare]|nr:heat shock cognate 70 kda protein 1 [Hordeum vulgare]